MVNFLNSGLEKIYFKRFNEIFLKGGDFLEKPEDQKEIIEKLLKLLAEKKIKGFEVKTDSKGNIKITIK